MTVMATVAEWIEGARPRTLPNAVAPVLVGGGAAAALDAFTWWQALLALLVALALIIGVNYANDYSDGVRGTDTDRVGPLRLVGAGVALPKSVLRAALTCFGVAGILGLVLVATTGRWWMLAIGAGCILGAWFYTGGSRPYGYSGYGEVAVFLFFGLVAVLGTVYVQAGRLSLTALACSVAIGAFSAAVLVANNLRDIPTDTESGKRTLAVRLGDRSTRRLYLALIGVPFVLTVAIGTAYPTALLGLVAAGLVIVPLRAITGGSTGRGLIPVLRDTGLAMLAWSVLTSAGLALG